ncbi:MAG TPA: N-methyl-L-tryptophan oxidase [Thermomicrobiales bacterium]
MRADAQYEVIVLGLGGMGSATAYHLARRGRRVLGLDAFARGHHNGSSHGRSRGIREAYGESPAYVPLVQRAYALWRELEAETGQHLLTITGGISIGPAAPGFGANQKESAAQYGLTVEELTADAIMARWPGFRVPDDYLGMYDPHTGFLLPEPCVAAHLDLATRHGATLHHGEPVRRWSPDGAGVRVETDTAAYTADALVITAGPWAGEILRDLHLPLEPWRMYNIYFAPTRPELFGPDHFPVYGIRGPEGSYYGVPMLPGDGLKIGRHDRGDICTPETARRTVEPAEIALMRAVLDTYMPGATGDILSATTCLYTMTPDSHFVIDRHPEHARVVYAVGFSGHGFKFSAAIGEVMADLATDGTTRHPVGFLSAARFAVAAA